MTTVPKTASSKTPQSKRKRIPPGRPGLGRKKSKHTSRPAVTSRPHSSLVSRQQGSQGDSPISTTPPGTVQPPLYVGFRMSNRPFRPRTRAPAEAGMVGTTTGSSGTSPASASRMDMMLGASAALGGRVAAGCASPASRIKAGALTVNVESGLEGAVALLAWADLPNLEALDPDQIAWARGRYPSFPNPRLGSLALLQAGAGRRVRAGCWWLGHALLIFV